jgi:hypothetical protein
MCGFYLHVKINEQYAGSCVTKHTAMLLLYMQRNINCIFNPLRLSGNYMNHLL